MLAVPKSLDGMLSPFEPFVHDPANNAEAMNLLIGRVEQTGPRWWTAAKRMIGNIGLSDDAEFDIGAITDLGAIIGVPMPRFFRLPVRIRAANVAADHSEETRRRLAREQAKAYADKLRRAGRQHALNVFVGQDDEKPPLPYFAGSRSWADGDIVLVEAALRLDENGGLYLADFPPGLDLRSDRRLPLVFTDGIAAGLIERVRQRDGWEPFCQVLAQVESTGRDYPVLRVILVSLRNFVVGAQDLSPERVFASTDYIYGDDEWKSLRTSWIGAYYFATRDVIDVLSNPAERLQRRRGSDDFDKDVKKLVSYERSFCTNALGYIAGVQVIMGELRRIGADVEAARLLEALQDRVTMLRVNDAELLQEIAESMAPLRVIRDPEPRRPAAVDQGPASEGREAAAPPEGGAAG